MNEPTEETFLKDVREHGIEIIRDAGENRHIRFSKPKTMCMHFDLITWPGYLCYTGDMGTYVFRRVKDMFTFFRHEEINPDYWSEKLEATDRGDGHEEWSREKFEAAIRANFAEWLSHRGLEPEIETEARERFEDEIVGELEGGRETAYMAAYDFEVDSDFPFVDFVSEVNSDEYTYRFIWCCRALVWGIAQYDKAKEQATKEAA